MKTVTASEQRDQREAADRLAPRLFAARLEQLDHEHERHRERRDPADLAAQARHRFGGPAEVRLRRPVAAHELARHLERQPDHAGPDQPVRHAAHEQVRVRRDREPPAEVGDQRGAPGSPRERERDRLERGARSRSGSARAPARRGPPGGACIGRRSQSAPSSSSATPKLSSGVRASEPTSARAARSQ